MSPFRVEIEGGQVATVSITTFDNILTGPSEDLSIDGFLSCEVLFDESGNILLMGGT